MTTQPSTDDTREARPGPRDLVTTMLATVLFLLTVAAAGLTSLRYFENEALVDAASRISMAHAEARMLAIQGRVPTYLHIDADAGLVWVEVAGKGFARHVQPRGVRLDSDRRLLCFDAGAQPLVGGACEAHFGAISLRSVTGEAVFHIDAQGRLHRL